MPGATLNYYPAFWVRDAAMMLVGSFIPAAEVEGWVRIIAAVQPGAEGLRFGRLIVPPYSIPDHITVDGQVGIPIKGGDVVEACKAHGYIQLIRSSL